VSVRAPDHAAGELVVEPVVFVQELEPEPGGGNGGDHGGGVVDPFDADR
jgi:hypothetical protein